jgi:GNAT superfamily N-acetyltransferase
MIVSPLNVDLVPRVQHLMELGTPYIRVRTESDYWLYASLFSSTCPVVLIDGEVAGAIIAFRSQNDPDDVYVQDVMTHPDHRHKGVASALLAHLRDQARQWGCTRIYLTSEPSNTAAQAAWRSFGYRNLPGDHTINGVSVIKDFKGLGKDRAVYQLDLS